MNRLLLFALAFVLFFTACKNSSNTEENNNTKEEHSTQQDEVKNEEGAKEEDKAEASGLAETPTIKAIKKEDIPFDYIFTPVGKGLVDAFEVKDKTGTKYLLRGRNFLEGNIQMVATYLEATGDQPKILTTALEDLQSCKFDLVDEHIKEVKISDMDNDGQAEVMMMFKLDCTSDLSPNRLYLALFEGADRYLIKGYTEVEGMGGTLKADEAFQANETFLNAATEFWNKHKKENHK